MAQLQKGSPEFMAKVAEMKELAARVKELEVAAKDADERFKEAFMTVPNIPQSQFQMAKEKRIIKLFRLGEKSSDLPYAIPHFDIMFNQMIYFQRGVKVIGAGFLLCG